MTYRLDEKILYSGIIAFDAFDVEFNISQLLFRKIYLATIINIDIAEKISKMLDR